jgi:hypothetical protein
VRVDALLLFGSRARGEHLLASDVDLVVVSPDFAGLGYRERVQRVTRLWTGRVGLDAICLTPEEARRRQRERGLVGSALRGGIPLGHPAARSGRTANPRGWRPRPGRASGREQATRVKRGGGAGGAR